MTGTVKFFNDSKGFGFIKTEQGEDVFFHRSSVKETGFRSNLCQGDTVMFEIRSDGRGKRAFNIVRT